MSDVTLRKGLDNDFIIHPCKNYTSRVQITVFPQKSHVIYFPTKTKFWWENTAFLLVDDGHVISFGRKTDAFW